MRWLALLCWLGAATTLAPWAFIEDRSGTEQDRILHLMNDGFSSGPGGEEFNTPNSPTEKVHASAKAEPCSLPVCVKGVQ